MNTRNTVIGVAVICLVVLGALAWRKEAAAPKINPVVSGGNEESAVRDLVSQFGSHLKDVALLAPDAAQQIQAVYSPYVAEPVLVVWEKDPLHAPGRLTSSPAPTGITIITIEKQSDGSYEVQGNINESTSSGPAEGIPLALKVSHVDGRWMIVGAEIAFPKK